MFFASNSVYDTLYGVLNDLLYGRRTPTHIVVLMHPDTFTTLDKELEEKYTVIGRQLDKPTTPNKYVWKIREHTVVIILSNGADKEKILIGEEAYMHVIACKP